MTISVVGIGYSNKSLDQKSLETLHNSDVVIGHPRFLEQSSPLLKEGCVAYDVESKSREGFDFRLERVKEAEKHSQRGLKVSMVSCGNSTIFGMANYALQLSERKRDISVLPGQGAVQYISQALGAPFHFGFLLNSFLDDHMILEDKLLEVSHPMQSTLPVEMSF